MAVVDSYSESNYDGAINVNGTQNACGQSFTGDGTTLDSVQFYIQRRLTPSGNVVVRVYAHSGTFGTSSVPTGSILATSDAIAVSAIATSYTLTTFTFSGAERITLTAATKYVAVLYYAGTSIIDVGGDSSSPTHGGNLMYYFSGWNPLSGWDTCFYVNGVVAGDQPTMRRWGGVPGMGQGQSFGRSW